MAIVLHTAAWLVPVATLPIKKGAVAVAAGKIVAVGPLAEVQARFPGVATHDHGEAALTPALINAHSHLELAHLRELSQQPHVGSFTAWVTKLIALRSQKGDNGAASAALAECRRLYDEGVSVLADIGNSDLPLGLMDRFPGRLLAFHEYLGITERDSDRNRARLQLEADSRLCSAHAPYSTHPALLQALKSRARRLGQILPIHVAEPPEELELLRSGGGEMAAFSRARAQDELHFQPAVAPTEGSIHYLYRLGLLDAETLCVHAVHLSEAELDILAGTGAKVCLCPGSNRFLGVGSAPVLRFLAHGILPALGTDSSASNPELSLWREMRLLAETPGLKPETIFAMATLGGAAALGLDRDFGSLAVGKSADMILVPLDRVVPDPAGLMQALISSPGRHVIKRIAP